MRKRIACFRRLLLLIVVASPLCSLGQRPDTVHSDGKVFVRENGVLRMYDPIELRAKPILDRYIWDSINAAMYRPEPPASAKRPVVVNSIPCNVKASFTPDKDLVIRNNTSILLTSTSTNATELKWYQNGFYYSSGNTFQLNGYVGLSEIKLVAVNGNCTDTFRTWFFVPGEQPANRDNMKAYYGLPNADDHARALIAVRGGGFLLGGFSDFYGRINNKPKQGLLMRVNDDGCVLWTRYNDPTYTSDISGITQTRDDNFAVFAVERNQPYLMKIDQNGNQLWSKKYKIFGDPFFASKVVATDDGGMILLGSFQDKGVLVIRLDANGNVRWNKMFSKDPLYPGGWNWYSFSDAVQRANELYIGGTAAQTGGGSATTVYSGFVMRLDDANGNIIWSKKYSINGNDVWIRNIILRGPDIIVQSNGGTGVPNGFSSVHEMDVNGQMTRSVTLGLPVGGSFDYTGIKATPAGDLYVLNTITEPLQLQPYYAFHSIGIRLDNDLQQVWAKDYGAYAKGRYFFIDVGKNNSLAMLGDEIGMTVPYFTSFGYKMMFKRIEEWGAAQWDCGNYDHNVNIVQTPTVGQPLNWEQEQQMPIQAVDSVIQLFTTYGQVRYVCPTEFVDSCSFLKMDGKDEMCNITKPYTYSIVKNSTCTQPVKWELPQGATIVAQTNDEVTLRFSSLGEFWIKAELPFACSPSKDSILVKATSSALSLNLGNDTIICKDTYIQLQAGTGFNRYNWQDGSADPVFSVTDPGKYWVETEDACENVFSDTLYVTPANISINLGADLQKCNDETLVLTAPAGYLNYSWLTDYHISHLSNPVVTIQPDKDTSYILKAEQMPGCFAYDTVAVKVLHSPAVLLGPDRSFCTGDTWEFAAGSGFASYLWNTGAATEKITVDRVGEYSVIATSANGCASYDTVRVPLLYPLPQPVLDPDRSLCKDDSRILDPGKFNSYLWQDGSSNRTFTATGTGIYQVEVRDANNCVGNASVEIDKILPLPEKFLPNDTVICGFDRLLIRPLKQYDAYHWSTGDRTNTLEIKKAGIYSLEVTDHNNCRGTDQILISPKDCLKGVFIPSGFTPNQDSNNDVFRAIVHGPIETFELSLFNRWGQKIWNTNNPKQGWDGSIGGIQQPAGSFVYICNYKFQGEPLQTQKGNMMLVR
ncbi:MAG: gliding motility-associated C-terminal domain-containing protein [Chitinophagaceae bacterium]|nr:gliding motility-associated C-terminal domain-containing protein [Chitinophagaceae bacterium]